MKTWLKITLPLLAAAGAFVAWRALRPAAETGPRYRVAAVERGDIVRTVSATGTISAVSTVEVGSQVSGNILRLHADYNDPVTAGQLVAEIDPATYQARVVQAEGDLASAEALLELKQIAFTRAEQLLARQLVAQSDHDQARAELRQQEAAVKIKSASLESAKLDLEHTRIYSPIDGVVISRSVDVGQTVQASYSAPELFNIAQDLRQMQIAANVSEADIGDVEPGQPVSFTVDAFPGRAFRAEVKQVRKNSTTTSNVVTYTTIITVDNADLKLLPGMTASVVITTARRENVLRVANGALRFNPPASAVVRHSGENPPARDARLAYELAAPPGPDGRGSGELVPVAVRAGLSDTTHTEILSGLDEGAILATGAIVTASANTASTSSSSSNSSSSNPFQPSRPPGGGPPR